MSSKHTTLFGYPEAVKKKIFNNCYIEPEVLMFLDSVMILQMLLFFGTVIALSYTAFKYSRLGVKIRCVYTLDLVYDKHMFPLRQGIAVLLLYYYIVLYCLLYPRLFIVGIYRPGQLLARDSKEWVTSTIKFIVYKYILIW